MWPDVAPPTFVPATNATARTPDALLVDASNAAYTVWLNTYTQRIYEHQDRDSTIIFVMVNVLAGCGLFFAWVQFRQAARSTAAPGWEEGHGDVAIDPAEENAIPERLVQSGTFSHLKGVTLKPSLVGLIILGLTMGFYILYLRYAYPLTIATPDDKSLSLQASSPRGLQNGLPERNPTQ